MRLFWAGTALSAALFSTLLIVRLDLFNAVPDQFSIAFRPDASVPDKDTWKNIFQNRAKIGVSHSSLSHTKNGYRLEEALYLRINTMGLVQDVRLHTAGSLHSDFSLASFEFEIGSGRFRFFARGSVAGNTLTIIAQSAGSRHLERIRLDRKLYLTTGLLDAVIASSPDDSRTMTLFVFDPASMSQQPVDIRLLGRERLHILGQDLSARKVSLVFKGATQYAWIGDSGEILKEQGLLGITLEKTTRSDALFGLPIASSQDLTRIAAIPANVVLAGPAQLKKLRVKISGIRPDALRLGGGRQTLHHDTLTIVRESLDEPASAQAVDPADADLSEFLKPALFIQSDHPKIKRLAASIFCADDPPSVKAEKLVNWVYRNIEKRPVLSLPDAVSTLENGVGDCNEHAMLLAALARAAGIPSKVEAGLVYLRGSFYYHAWNALYLGKWVTADALFGQLPADVTHIRFAGGAHSLQLDIMAIIGKLRLEILPQGGNR